jgi:hypothetical protein
MDPKVQGTSDEWHQCLEAGTRSIRRGFHDSKNRPIGLLRLGIYHLPSFQDCFCWTIYETKAELSVKIIDDSEPIQSRTEPWVHEPVVHTLIWHQEADRQRIHDNLAGKNLRISGTPTFSELMTKVDSQWLAERLNTFSRIRLPLLIERAFGCDGEIFGVFVPEEFNLEWWCSGPPEWRDLAEWTTEMVTSLRVKLP